jgi:branched-chain amino acid transport system permease protein
MTESLTEQPTRGGGRGARHRRTMAERWSALPGWQQILGAIAVVVFLYYLPYLGIPGLNLLRTDQQAVPTDWSSTLFTCALWVVIALGLNIVIGLAGLLDLGYVGFFAIGAYSVALFGSPFSPVVHWIQGQFDLPRTWAMAWAATIPIAIALTMTSGVILGWPTLRLRGDYLAIVTLGFAEIIRIVARNSEFTLGPQGIAAIPGPPGTLPNGEKIFGLLNIAPWYWLALTVLLVVVLLVRRLENSRVGRSWLAIREDEDAAALMGVHGFKFKLWAFAMGAALGGLSGILFASRQGFIDPNQFSVVVSITFVAAVVMGGAGNMLGVAVGAILLVYLPERFRDLQEYRPFFVGLALVIIMIFRPQGLIPSRRRSRELADRAEEAPENV